jgi:hypothetical protein
MKALIVCPLYPPNRSGSAIHMAHIAQGLADDGISVTVWTTDAKDTHYFVDRSMRRVEASQEIMHGVKVRRFPLSSWSMNHRGFYESLRKAYPPFEILPHIAGCSVVPSEKSSGLISSLRACSLILHSSLRDWLLLASGTVRSWSWASFIPVSRGESSTDRNFWGTGCHACWE